MVLIYIVVFAGIFGAIGQYLDKYLVNLGISRKDYFYDQMREVCVSMKEANASAVSGIAAFAGRCGVREMMRIASIITDSAGKGAALAEKLGRESRMLWFMRKKRSEEKGRIAETKMTLPLMILLMVLILIAVAPAMMDM